MEGLGAHHLSLVLCVLGLGRLVSCWLSSHLAVAPAAAAAWPSRVASLAAYCLFQTLLLLFSLASSSSSGIGGGRPALVDDVAVFYAVAFVWGVTDALIYCHVMGE